MVDGTFSGDDLKARRSSELSSETVVSNQSVSCGFVLSVGIARRERANMNNAKDGEDSGNRQQKTGLLVSRKVGFAMANHPMSTFGRLPPSSG